MRDSIRYEYFGELRRHLDDEVIVYFNKEPLIKKLLTDYLLLVTVIREHIISGTLQFDEGTAKANASEVFIDYSFVIAPIYKAFEGYLFLLAESLGLKSRQEIKKSIGACYDEEQITKIKKEIVTETGNRIEKTDREALGRISELKRVLEQYRHSPAHFVGKSPDTFQKATNYGGAILTAINEATEFFLERGDISTN